MEGTTRREFLRSSGLFVGGAIVGVFSTFGVMHRNESQIDAEQPQPTTEEPPIETTVETTVATTNMPPSPQPLSASIDIDVALKRLTPSDYVGTFTIDKWTGDDEIALVPKFASDMNPTHWQNYLTIISKDGILAQYTLAGEGSIEDIQLTPTSIVGFVKTTPNTKRICEFDYAGNCKRGLILNDLSHQAELTKDGTFMIVTPQHEGVAEIDWGGNILWQWSARDHIKEFTDDDFHGLDYMANIGDAMTNMYSDYRQSFKNGGTEWTHTNSAQKLDNGNYLIGLRNLDLVAEVTSAGDIVWTFGGLLIRHAHHPRMLDNGNLIIYDNGNNRAIEITSLGKVIFEYPVYAPVFGWITKMDNSNYVFPDCFGGKILEIAPNGEVVKAISTGLLYEAKMYNTADVGVF